MRSGLISVEVNGEIKALALTPDTRRGTGAVHRDAATVDLHGSVLVDGLPLDGR